MLVNEPFGTRPLVVHAAGHHRNIPHWEPIKKAFFARPRQKLGKVEDLAILTWNNGDPRMGMLERSLDHLGVPYRVAGAGIEDWVNSRDKPRATLRVLEEIDAGHVLGVDSRDALILGDPTELLSRFRFDFSCSMVFAGERINWPNLRRFRLFEESLPGARDSDFRYLSGGAWIGRTSFVRTVFEAATEIEPLTEALDSEQGILKQLFPRFHPDIQVDYRCSMFQNIGFVAAPILRID